MSNNLENPNTILRKSDGTEIGTVADPVQVAGPVTVAALPLPAGAATAAAQGTGNASLSSIDTKTPALVTGRVPVDGSGVTQPVSGSVAITNFPGTQAVSGPLTDTQLRATAVPVSAAALPLPSGAATSAAQGTGNASLSSIDAKAPALVSGRVPVDGSGVIQPVIGVVSVDNFPADTALTDAQLRASPVDVTIDDIKAGLDLIFDALSQLPMALDAASGRLRVMLDPLGGAQTLGTITSVGTVTTVTTTTTVGTVTNQAQIGGTVANSVVLDAMANAWGTLARGRIA
jgi:hypothetical protein